MTLKDEVKSICSTFVFTPHGLLHTHTDIIAEPDICTGASYLRIPLLDLSDCNAFATSNARARVTRADEPEFSAVAYHPRLVRRRRCDSIASPARRGGRRVAESVDADVVSQAEVGARRADGRVPGIEVR